MEEPKTKEDIKNLLKHLETEYRKANISEKSYKELKEKYKSQLLYIENTITEPVAEAPNVIEPVATTPAAPTVTAPEQNEQKKGKGGLFGKLLHKSKENSETAPSETQTTQPTETTPETSPAQSEETSPAPEPESAPSQQEEQHVDISSMLTPINIEIEKIKAIIDAMREQKKTSDESIQSIFENMGELRSASIQNDATAKEITSKLEKTEEDISQVRPKEIDKKFRDTNETLEKYQLSIEKLQAKTDDMAERLNKVHDMLKVIGNIENLEKLNDNVQKKLEDIKEATNYVERLASKTEKMFMEIKRDLEDVVIYRSKQDGMEETVRDITRNLDAMGVKFEGYSTKKDLDDEKQGLLLVNKELESIKQHLGLVDAAVPEPIVRLRKERDDINIFLDTLEEHNKAGKIKKEDYDSAKSKNLENLKAIEAQLEEEWKKFEQAPKVVQEVKDAKTETKDVKAETKEVKAEASGKPEVPKSSKAETQTKTETIQTEAAKDTPKEIKTEPGQVDDKDKKSDVTEPAKEKEQKKKKEKVPATASIPF